MNFKKIGTYVLIGLIITGFALILINLSPVSSYLEKITGLFFPAVSTVTVLGVPEPPELTAWVENINEIGYQNGTVHLNWTASISPYIQNYVLYATYNYSAGFGGFTNPYKIFPYSDTSYIDTDAAPHSEIYYILRANTTYGLEDDNNNTWGKYTRTLYSTSQNSNMNLISTGPISINKTFKDIFIQNTTNYTVIQVYRRDDRTGFYSLADYYGAYGYDVWWSPDSSFTTIEPDEAYWVKVIKNTSWPVVGNITKQNRTVQLYSTPLNGEMNLVGWTSVVHTDFSDAIKQNVSDYNVTQVYRRDDRTGFYSLADYYGAYGFDLWWSPDSSFTGFDPGYGYWLKTDENMTWIYEPNKV